MCVFCVCICSDSLPVVGVDVWPQPGEGAPLQDKFAAVIYAQMSVCRVYRPVSVSLSIAENHAWICQCLLSWWKTLTSRWKHASLARDTPGSTVPTTQSSSAEIQPHLFPQNSIKASTTVQRFHVPIGRNPMSASSPPSLPRAFLHSLSPHRPSSPSSSQSPPGPLYMRLSNGSHSVSSPTNSRGSFHGVSFLLQIGLTRETVNLEASDLSLSAVKDLVCSIVDQKVRMLSPSKPLCLSASRECYFWSVLFFFLTTVCVFQIAFVIATRGLFWVCV